MQVKLSKKIVTPKITLFSLEFSRDNNLRAKNVFFFPSKIITQKQENVVKEKKNYLEMAIQVNHLHISTFPHRKQPITHRSSTFKLRAVSGQQLIQSGAVKAIPPKEAAIAINSDGYTLLDIRPEWEREKARVSGSLHVPLFVEDKDSRPITLLKKWVHFGYIGAWTGQNFTMINDDFVGSVEKEVPDKDTKLLVACGEGLR